MKTWSVAVAVCLLAACRADRPASGERFFKVRLQETEIPAVRVERVIPLETRPDLLLGPERQFQAYADGYAAYDDKRVVLYDRTGAARGLVHAVGRSEREYLSISDVRIVGDTVYVRDPGLRRTLCFGLDGSYLGRADFYGYGHAFFVRGNTVIEDITGFREAEGRCLAVTDRSGAIRNRSVPMRISLGFNARQKFVCREGRLFYVPSFSYTVFELDEAGNATPYYRFDFGPYEVTQAELDRLDASKDIWAFRKGVQKGGKVLFLNFHENAQAVALDFTRDFDFKASVERYFWYFDKATGRSCFLPERSGKPSVLRYPVQCMDGEWFVTAIEASDYREHFQDLRPLELSENDNPVLVVYRFAS